MDQLLMILQDSLVSIAILLVVALGGLMSEKSGVTNIALEGLMLVGALFGLLVMRQLEISTNLPIQIIYLLGLISGGIAALIYSSLHAVAAIKFNADQTISATALNIFAAAFVVFYPRSVIGGAKVTITNTYRIPSVGFLADIPIIGDLFFKRAFLSLYVVIIIFIIISIYFKKTKAGMRHIAVGENPHAADAAGINIYKMRYFAVLSSGFLAGMGGTMFAVTSGIGFDQTVSGLGFLSIAVLIFGNWKTGSILMAAIFFGFFRNVAASYSNITFLNQIAIPVEFYKMLPYILTIVVLVFFSKRSRAPKAVGQVYDQGKR